MVANLLRGIFTELKNPTDLYASLRPLLTVCFVSGIAPFKVIGSAGNRHLMVTVFGSMFALFHLVCFGTCYVLWAPVENVSYSIVARLGEKVQSIASIITIGVLLILCIAKRMKLQKLLHVLAQIDRKLVGFGTEIDHKYVLKIVWTVLIIQWTALFTSIGASYIFFRSYGLEFDIFQWVFFFLQFSIKMAYKSKHFCIMQLIKSRFSLINSTLKKLRMNAGGCRLRGNMNDVVITIFGETTYGMGKWGFDSNRQRYLIITELCQTHDVICDACFVAEQYFNHQILSIVITEFVLTLFDLYTIIDVTFVRSVTPGVDRTQFFAYFMHYTIITAATLFALLRSAESVTSEVSSALKSHSDKIILQNKVALNFRMKNVR